MWNNHICKSIKDSNYTLYLHCLSTVAEIDYPLDMSCIAYLVNTLDEKWITSLVDSNLRTWGTGKSDSRRTTKIYDLACAIFELYNENISEKIIKKILNMKLRNPPLYYYEDMAKHVPNLCAKYCTHYTYDIIKSIFIGCVLGEHYTHAKNYYHCLLKNEKKVFLLDEKTTIFRTVKQLEFVSGLTTLNYQLILEECALNGNIAMMKWIFSNIKNIIFELDPIFDNIGKFGNQENVTLYELLMDNGYDNYIKFANRVYRKYPELLFKYENKITCDEIPELFDRTHEVEDVYKLLYNLQYKTECFPLAFSVETLQNCITYAVSNETKNKDLKIKCKNKYILHLYVNDIVCDELEFSNDYTSTSRPIGNLMCGFVMKNNWNILSNSDKLKIARLYKKEYHSDDDNMYEFIRKMQSNIIKKLNYEQLKHFMTDKYNTLDGLYDGQILFDRSA